MELSAGPWEEGTDGKRPTYEEIQRPHAAMVLAAVGIAASLGIAYGYALGRAIGIATTLVALGLAALLLRRVRREIRVDERVVRVGAARLPIVHTGTPQILDPEQARHRRGGGADARAHFALRSWLPRAVLVPVHDDSDPHPYWLVSTRDPEALAAAIEASRVGARSV